MCPNGRFKPGDALDPPPSPELNAGRNPPTCDSVAIPPSLGVHSPNCCSPPSKYNNKWLVDPKKLWQIPYDDPDHADVLWGYTDDFTNNDKDDSKSSSEDGSDAYDFVKLDGPDGSLDNSFATSHAVVRRTKEIPAVKRSILTTQPDSHGLCLRPYRSGLPRVFQLPGRLC